MVILSLVARRQQITLDIDLLAQQHYFGVSPLKIRSESCNHARPSDNVRIEGRVSICKIAAGSGAGCGALCENGRRPKRLQSPWATSHHQP